MFNISRAIKQPTVFKRLACRSFALVPDAKPLYPISVYCEAAYSLKDKVSLEEINNHIKKQLEAKKGVVAPDVPIQNLQLWNNNANQAIGGVIQISDADLGWSEEIELKDAFLIVFRGSSNVYEWIEDIKSVVTKDFKTNDNKIFLGRAGSGFIDAYDDLRDYEPFTTSVKENLNKYKRVVIAGHSLGGAMATLCSLEVYKTQSDVKQALVTFGCPRTVDDKTADEMVNFPTQYGRFVNYGDPVPTAPDVGVKHTNEPWQFNNDGWGKTRYWSVKKDQDFGGYYTPKTIYTISAHTCAVDGSRGYGKHLL